MVEGCRMVRYSICAFIGLSVGATTTSLSEPLDLGPLHGRVVYLDFWASWCAPCRQSFPWMDSMQQTYGPQGLSVLAIDVDHDRGDADARAAVGADWTLPLTRLDRVTLGGKVSIEDDF